MEAQAGLRKQIADLEAMAAKFRRESAEAKEEIARIESAVAEEAVAALLDGAATVPEKTERRRRKIERLRSIIENTAAALNQLPARRRDVEEKLETLTPSIVDAALDEVSARRLAALEKVKVGLAEIAAPLAELAATDMLERDLLGEHFAFDPGKHPHVFAARVVVARFLENLPVRLTPEQLDAFTIRSQAAEIATHWLNDIKGN
ncbi:hypothetical protein [Aquamicrobium terrae]